MNAKQTIIAAVIVAGAILVNMCAFIVDQREQVLVLQFGNPQQVVVKPGLHFKLPWQSTINFERRLLVQDAPPNEVITKDKKSILVDAYTRWSIKEPLKVFQVARTEAGVAARMEDVVRGKIREVLGQHTLAEIVSGGENALLRTKLMLTIRDKADAAVRDLGVQISDVRIKRADLPLENSEAVFQRMKAERNRIAKEYRSEGEEAAKEIRAEAEKKRKVLIADAYKHSQIIRGKADAESTVIYAKAHNKDPEFYAFLRSLEAYKKSIGVGTSMVISPESEFFRFFNHSGK
ncbi:MAG: protease modulator HflC [Mariprofundaceae bacterium]